MKKLAAGLLTVGAAVAALVAVAPVAQADVCASAGGRHVSVGGCTHIAADAVAIASATTPYFPGEVPCYTNDGVPYYTPPGQPC
jgi:hypothetical protein